MIDIHLTKTGAVNIFVVNIFGIIRIDKYLMSLILFICSFLC